jgi:hypothetical protein
MKFLIKLLGSMSKKAILEYVVETLVWPLVIKMTPEIRQLMVNYILALWKNAKETSNSYDDQLVKMLATLVKMELP